MSRNFKRFLFASYAAALVLFFCLLLFMREALDDARRDVGLLSYNNEVIIVMQDVLISLQRAESNRRGYLLSRDRDYIRDYNSAVKSVQQSLFYMKQLNANGDYRDEFLDSLGASINSRVDLLKSSIDLAIGDSTSDSVQTALTDKGKELMGSIRSTILVLMNQRRNARDDNYRALSRVNDEINVLSELAIVVIVIFGGTVTSVTFFYFKKFNIVEDALRRDLFQARQQVQHATSRYQDLKVEMMEKMKSGESGSAKES